MKTQELLGYADEIRIIRFTCSFCSSEEDFERSDFTAKSKTEAINDLVGDGWKELSADSVEGLACPACVAEFQSKGATNES